MSAHTKTNEQRFWSVDMLYSAALAVIGAAIVAWAIAGQGSLFGEHGYAVAGFFLVFGLFTITMGFPHPGFGHVSFDRVGQISAILVLGPVGAAVVCGVASFLYPWKRLLEGEQVRLVVMAALHNAGLMSLVVLGGGLLYTSIGGSIPPGVLNWPAAGHLLVLIFGMQVLNDLGMLLIFRLRGQEPGRLLTTFTTSVETVSALMAILVALVFTRYEPGVVALLLLVLSIGMLILKRYAEMRSRLEALVDERTEELRQKTLELEYQATRDKLTGLYNRRYADEYLERQLEQARRSRRPLVVALADIDHFKRINDQHSHAAGDRVLEQVARILSRRCRQSDVVARYGGEEFLLCFPDTSLAFAEQLCGELRQAVESADWAGVAGGDRVTMSFGVALAGTHKALDDLLNEADARLYRAKHGGRNRVVA